MSQILINAIGGGGGVITAINGGNNITVSTIGTVATVNVSGTTQFALQTGSAAGALNSLALGTAGQVLVSNGAGSNPSFQTVSLATVFPWTVVAANTGMAVNNGYITNSAGSITVTLPAVAAVGSIVEVTGIGTGQWVIGQNAGQAIFFGNNVSTTVGVTGSLASQATRDHVRLLCVIANTTWNLVQMTGNINYN